MTQIVQYQNKFDEFCAETGLSDIAIARQLDISSSYVGKMRSGERRPGSDLQGKIYRWSDHVVDANSWHEDMTSQAGTTPAQTPNPDQSQKDFAA
jgi:transcriptional regulator with XRE-family HTH domain